MIEMKNAFMKNHCMLCGNRKRLRFTAFTLIELLVVIGIMLVLVAVALPSIRMLTKGNSVREAARVVNTFIESARSDAATNEFGGIWIERSERDPNKATRIYKIRRPQTYSGDTQNAQARILHGGGYGNSVPPIGPCGAGGNSTIVALFRANENQLFEPDLNGHRGIGVNDRIQFDNKGPWYIIQQVCGDVAGNDTIVHPDDPDPTNPTIFAYACEVALSTADFSLDRMGAFDDFNAYVKPASHDVTFRIERTPMKSTRDFIELPKGTYINLADSGFAITDINRLIENDNRGGGAEFSSTNTDEPKVLPVIITFRKDGSVDRVDYELNIETQPYPAPADFAYINKSQFPPSSIFLHIANEREDLNNNISPLEDLDSLWVTISRTGGIVATSDTMPLNGAANVVDARANARRGARDGQNLTGN